MTKRKYSSKELREIAEVLNKSDQLAELLTHVALQAQLENEEHLIKDEEEDYEPCLTALDLADSADQYAWSVWFDDGTLYDKINSLVETVAKQYKKNLVKA